jgi:Arc-like DNA binding domain
MVSVWYNEAMYEQPRVAMSLRLPVELRDALQRSAHEHRRSLTAEIIRRLERSVRADERRRRRSERDP